LNDFQGITGLSVQGQVLELVVQPDDQVEQDSGKKWVYALF